MTFTWPGEALCIKIVETFENGIGGILAPWQIKREASARAEGRRIELLLLEQAQQDVERIRSGKVTFDNKYRLLPSPSTPEPKQIADRSSDAIAVGTMQDRTGIEELAKSVMRNGVADDILRQINLRKILVIAQQEAEGTPNESVSADPVEPDWFRQWRSSAQDVSREEMQRLWARVLKGEVAKPGSYSVRTLNFLASMSKADAELIEKMARLRIGRGLLRDSALAADFGLNLADFVYLEDIGFINGVAGGIGMGGLAITINNNTTGSFEGHLVSGRTVFRFFKEDANAKPSIPAYTLSHVGQEILTLASVETDERTFQKVVKLTKDAGFRVKRGTFVPVAANSGLTTNETDL